MSLVSVIIPTYRRAALVQQAVRTVLEQTFDALEVLVVIDGIDTDGTRAAIDDLTDPRARVFETGINRGPAEARNFGVQQAKGTYIALLDDDDEWTANKLETQISFLRRYGIIQGEFLLSCRTIQKNSVTKEVSICPKNLFEMGDDLSEYLLDRRHPFNRPGMVASGTLLFPRALALRVPFPDDEVHEDWSWLLRCVMRDKVPLLMCEEAMFVYNLDPAPSRNTKMDWRKSLGWGVDYRSLMSGRAFAGLVSSTTAMRAKRQEGARAFFEIARAMHREGDATLWHWITLMMVMSSPMEFAERLRQKTIRWSPDSPTKNLGMR